MKKGIRSPFFYVGDKYKLMPQLNKLFPNNINQFIEPFVGGGSVFLNTKAKRYLANDIDTNIVFEMGKSRIFFGVIMDIWSYKNTKFFSNISAIFNQFF